MLFLKGRFKDPLVFLVWYALFLSVRLLEARSELLTALFMLSVICFVGEQLEQLGASSSLKSPDFTANAHVKNRSCAAPARSLRQGPLFYLLYKLL